MCRAEGDLEACRYRTEWLSLGTVIKSGGYPCRARSPSAQQSPSSAYFQVPPSHSNANPSPDLEAGGMTMSEAVATSQPWYRSLNRSQWNILLAANLGWLFDGFELYALFLTVGPAMRALLGPSQYPQIPVYIGMVVAITLLGWGIGGIVGGLLADYIGRKRTMILAILAYSITTGLTAISFDWVSFALLRFLVGISIGS